MHWLRHRINLISVRGRPRRYLLKLTAGGWRSERHLRRRNLRRRELILTVPAADQDLDTVALIVLRWIDAQDHILLLLLLNCLVFGAQRWLRGTLLTHHAKAEVLGARFGIFASLGWPTHTLVNGLGLKFKVKRWLRCALTFIPRSDALGDVFVPRSGLLAATLQKLFH